MFSNILFSHIIKSASNEINIFFALIIFILFIIGCYFSITKKYDNFREFIPSLCASIGVFGTFLGIFAGLSEFDTTKISESIPNLLEGMKTAFFTSLVGMMFSLLLKAFYNIKNDKSKQSNDELIILQNIEKYSNLIQLKVEEMNKTFIDLFKSDADHSLVNQITLIRTEIRDNHVKTQESLREMIDKFAEMASKSLVEQLNTVVDKFNAMLNDLVAESFRKLTESTDNLNKWQDSYKNQIIQNEEFLHNTLEELHNIQHIYAEISRKTIDINESMISIDSSLAKVNISGDKLVIIADTLHKETLEFENSINQVKKIGDEAKSVIPEIQNKFNMIIDDIKSIQQKTVKFVSDTTDIIKNSTEYFKNQVTEQTNNYTSHITDSTTLLQNASKDIANIVQNSTNSIEEVVNKHIESTQNGLNEALTKSLTTFAGSMSELSRRFAEDYVPLTEKLREVVRIAEKISN